MKRKAERIMAWIANGLSILFILLMALVFSFMNVPEFKEAFNQMNQQQGIEMSMDTFKTTIIFQGILLIISTILGIIGTLIIKGNRVLAGCVFIIAAITSIFSGNFVALVLWLIVGIMLFVKKDKQSVDTQGRTLNDGPTHNRNQQSDMNLDREMKQKKDDDPYIY
ncbi:DUF4064 domain-containing protein [Staphylococcus edaphicus]|uniref:DUF4064 domain-containing protein n=1 Tax=Staphylococcus edaphicus TaxID=1955013 RepID=A0A2C6WR36_9STAP|nr:DUF4064 domain-containing protein [Staphylococcus edaphicus]PHK50593.1 hypothetical protein BTJ66_01770 [Staphylococcus edaphicus]UQW80734.1 DUF4064 domain-containing protein [Staphylococcus edaphicus]